MPTPDRKAETAMPKLTIFEAWICDPFDWPRFLATMSFYWEIHGTRRCARWIPNRPPVGSVLSPPTLFLAAISRVVPSDDTVAISTVPSAGPCHLPLAGDAGPSDIRTLASWAAGLRLLRTLGQYAYRFPYSTDIR